MTTMTQADDIEIIKRVQQGDKAAFNLLVAKYQYRLKLLVARFIKDNDEQEDVVQETFVKAYRALDKFRGDSAFYTWLYRIGVNTAKNHLSANSRYPKVSNSHLDNEEALNVDDKYVVDLHTPVTVLENDELIEALRQAIDKLPEELREAILLREFDGLSYEAIADVVDCPIGTVRSRIFRAREQLEAAIKRLE